MSRGAGEGIPVTSVGASRSGIFVSSQAVDRWPARELLNRLRAAGVPVEHSPSNPTDRKDPRWAGWYESGLREALERCALFVVVVDKGWDSSTWMGEEAHAALCPAAGRKPLRAFFWNPSSGTTIAQGMAGYLGRELPVDVEDATRILAEEASRPPGG